MQLRMFSFVQLCTSSKKQRTLALSKSERPSEQSETLKKVSAVQICVETP